MNVVLASAIVVTLSVMVWLVHINPGVSLAHLWLVAVVFLTGQIFKGDYASAAQAGAALVNVAASVCAIGWGRRRQQRVADEPRPSDTH